MKLGTEFTTAVLAENLGHTLKFASTLGTGAAHSIWYIPVKLLRAALPFTFLAIPLGVAAIRRTIDHRLLGPLLFQLSMVLAVILLFSVAHSAQPYYVLPAIPGVSIILSALFAD